MTNPPTPPEGYRLMTDEEKPSMWKEDKYFANRSGWEITSEDGHHTVKEILSEGILILAYARKIKS